MKNLINKIFTIQNLSINNKLYIQYKIFGIKLKFKITAFSNHNEYVNFIKYTSNLKKNRFNILLVSHDFALTGAPLAVLNTAIQLKQRGYFVVIIGLQQLNEYNNYRKSCKENNIKCFASDLFKQNTEFFNTLPLFNFIFVNCSYSYPIIKALINQNYNKYLWRISEANLIKNLFNENYDFKYSIQHANNIFAVSELTKNILKKYNPNVELLLYGIDDVSSNYPKFNNQNGKLKFMILGSVQYRKAQYLCLYALELLPQNIKDSIELYFIGETTPEFENYCKYHQNNIHICGYLEGENKYNVMQDCDICLCPSIDDPNPQVVMEAMMLKKPCIVTDKVGQAKYITNKVDGLIIPANNTAAIAGAITYMVRNRDKLYEMGLKSRNNIYLEYFTSTKYINQVENVIKKHNGGNLNCKY